ncbi:hypothetical protein BLNAU_22593 [Blattamonas nauphoetae]|uniref:Uncharacterized protein n=1 Tax=Blattamonas nauphoetae TaxID=2049346 RepID=A0ABQ9WSK4_9EUKA|nr:hypothetical protein BLNAU_22593 [Blattamonas nauphoetae]
MMAWKSSFFSSLSENSESVQRIDEQELDRLGGWRRAVLLIDEICIMCRGQEDNLIQSVVTELVDNGVISKLTRVLTKIIVIPDANANTRHHHTRPPDTQFSQQNSQPFFSYLRENDKADQISTPLTPTPPKQTSPFLALTNTLLSLLSFNAQAVITAHQDEHVQNYPSLHTIVFAILFASPRSITQQFPITSVPLTHQLSLFPPPKPNLSDNHALQEVLTLSLAGIPSSSDEISSRDLVSLHPCTDCSYCLNAWKHRTGVADLEDESIPTFPLSSVPLQQLLPALRYLRSALHSSNTLLTLFFPPNTPNMTLPSISGLDFHHLLSLLDQVNLSSFLPPALFDHPSFAPTNPFYLIFTPFLKHRLSDHALSSSLLEFLLTLLPQNHSSEETRHGILLLFVYPFMVMQFAQRVRTIEMEGMEERRLEEQSFREEMARVEQNWVGNLKDKGKEEIMLDFVEWRLARFDCHSVATVQTINNHSHTRTVSFTHNSLLELPEVKGVGMVDVLEWLCRDEYILELCDAVSEALDEDGTLEADLEKWCSKTSEIQEQLLVDLKQRNAQTRLDAEQQRQEEWEFFVKSRAEEEESKAQKATVVSIDSPPTQPSHIRGSSPWQTDSPLFSTSQHSPASISRSFLSLQMASTSWMPPFPSTTPQPRSINHSLSAQRFMFEAGSPSTMSDSTPPLISLKIMSRSPATSEESSEAEQSIPTIFHSLHKSSSGKQTVPTAQSPKSTQSPPHEPKQPIFEELHCSPTDSHQLLFNTPPFPHSLLSAATSSSLPRPTPRPPSRQSPTLRPSGKEVETDTLGSFELVGIDEIEAVDTGHFNASSPFSSSPFTASLSRFSVSVPSDTATISFLPQNSPSDTQSLGLGMSTARNEPKQERSACRLRDLRLDRSADLRLDFSGSEPRLTLVRFVGGGRIVNNDFVDPDYLTLSDVSVDVSESSLSSEAALDIVVGSMIVSDVSFSSSRSIGFPLIRMSGEVMKQTIQV